MTNKEVNPLGPIGREIAVLDRHLIEVLTARMQAAQVVEHIKAVLGNQQPIFRADVEDRRIEEIRQYAIARGINPHFAETVLYTIINESCKIQMIQREDGGTYLHSVNDLSYSQLKSNLLELTRLIAPSYDDRYAELFPATRIYLEFEMNVIRSVIDDLDDNHRGQVLDIGCATGAASRIVAESFERVVGVDISPDMINIAKAKFASDDRYEFVVGDVEDPSFWQSHEDKSFDMVIMTLGTGGDLLNLSMVLGQIHRVLKNGGRFVFSFYHTNSLMKGYSKIPWLTSLAATIDQDRGCIDVHYKDQIFSLFAKSYLPEEIEELIRGNWVITDSWTCPTMSAVVPSSVLEDPASFSYFRETDHYLAPESNRGAYLLIAGRKS